MLGTRTLNITRNIFKYKLDAHGVRGAMVGGSVSADVQQSLGLPLRADTSLAAGSSGFPDTTGGMGEPHGGGAPRSGGADEERDDSTPEEFEKALESYDAVVVNFYAPWCPHCIQFEPLWRAAKEQVDALEFADDVALMKVDCNVHRLFCETRQQIDRFPTIRAFANGGTDMEMYNDNLDTSSVV
eukprot:631842-Prymnesium_polylepis.1